MISVKLWLLLFVKVIDTSSYTNLFAIEKNLQMLMFYILYVLSVVYHFKNINKLSHLIKAMEAHQVWRVLYWFAASSVWKRYISHIWGNWYVWGFKILEVLVYLSFVSMLSLALVSWKARMARWCTQLGPRLMCMSNYIISIQNIKKKLDPFFSFFVSFIF